MSIVVPEKPVEGPVHGDLPAGLPGSQVGLCAGSNHRRCIEGPVSYTHLDVYKRQGLSSYHRNVLIYVYIRD